MELKIEGRHEDVSHVVLPNILVPVSAEMEDGDHMTSGSFVQSSLRIGEESRQVVAAKADQEMHSHEGVSHMLPTDMLIPVCEKKEDDLSKEWTTAGEKSPLEEGRSQVSYLNGMSKEYWQICFCFFIGIGQYWIFKCTFLF